MIEDQTSRSEATPAHLYERLAQQVAQLIDHGTLRPGDRVPSVRRMITQQSVSASTVLQAYQLLECRGLIEARPQSGFYVRPRRWAPPAEPEMFRPASGSRKTNMADLVMECIDALNRPGLARLGAAVAAPELFPTRELRRSLASANRRQPLLGNTLDPSIGLPALRTETARRALESGCALSPDDIVITNGATEALHLCLQAVTKRGDTIAVESPTYFGVLQLTEVLGLRVCEIPTYPQEGVCLDELVERIASCRVKACVFMTNFSNPLGSCMPDAKKERLVALLAEREIPLIEDDIFGSLAFGPNRPRTAKAFDRQGLVLLCDAFTKTLAPGYRIGWTAPGRFKAAVHRLKHVCSCANPVVTQLALAEFLGSGSYEHHLRRLRRTYAGLVERMREAVARYFPPGTRVTRPQGGHVLWVELPGNTDGLELHRAALAEGISIAPGPIFSARQQYRNCLRLKCANPWTDQLEQAVAKLGRMATRR